MSHNLYLALFRGINVGGNNLISMADLRKCFEGMGFSGVTSYIQSGNLIFGSEEMNMAALTARIGREMSARFSYDQLLILLDAESLQAIMREAPEGFGTEPGKYRYDVIFLKDTLQPGEVLRKVKVRTGVDTADAGSRVLFFSRLTARARQSLLKNVMALPEYKAMTVRNWNTVRKLAEIMEVQGKG